MVFSRRWLPFSLPSFLAVFAMASACGVILVFWNLLSSDQGIDIEHPVAATGRLTVRGKPGSGWQVIFQYDEFDMQGANAIGLTDEKGRFTMATPSLETMGVYPGRYKVGLVPPKRPRSMFSTGSGGMYRQFMFPKRFADPNKSGLQVEVREYGSNDFPFDIYPQRRHLTARTQD